MHHAVDKGVGCRGCGRRRGVAVGEHLSTWRAGWRHRRVESLAAYLADVLQMIHEALGHFLLRSLTSAEVQGQSWQRETATMAL